MTDEVQLSELEDVLVIRLNRPHARNAVDLAMARALADAIEMFDRRRGLRVAVLSSNGPTFCAGMDLKGFSRGEVPNIEGRGFAGITEAPPQKPMVAAVEGHAVAGGCELVLACDLIVAATGARFGIPEVTRGLVAAGGGLARLPKRIPYHIAMELALTGDTVDGHRAAELGLANRVVPDGTAEPVALELARVIASNAPLAIQTSKHLVRQSQDWPDKDWPHLQAPHTQAVFRSADAQEGARAFAERRAPVWTGS